MRSARSYRHASAPSAVRPRHEYALGPSSRQYLMKEVIRCHQASSGTRTLLEAVPDEGGHQVSSGVLRRPQVSSGVLSSHQASSVALISVRSTPRHRHQASSGVIRRHQASSGVISRHQASSGVIRRHQASSGVIRHHQASSVISVRSTPRHPAVVGAPDREHLAAVGRRVAKEENARPCPPLGGRHTEHRALTPLRPRLNELAVVPVGRRCVAPW